MKSLEIHAEKAWIFLFSSDICGCIVFSILRGTEMEEKEKLNMTDGSLWDKILIFALPIAATGILQQLFNAADVAVVGQFVSKQAMAAVGANSSVVNIMVTLFVGISLGANVVISRFTGRKDMDSVEKAVHTAILVSLISGIFVTIFGELIARGLLELMTVPEDVMDMAVLYLRVYLIGMPVILLYNFESAIYQSQGDTKTPLFALVVSGLINVALNLFFVVVVGMTVDGVATATVISNVISSGLLFYFLCRGKLPISIRREMFHIDRDLLGMMLRVGLPAGIQGMVFSISNVIIQAAVNSLGTDAVAGSSAAFNIEILGYFLVNSFSQACTTFVSQNYGAGKLDRCRKTLKTALLESTLIGGGFSFLLVAFGRQLLQIFNGDPAVISYGYERLFWILCFETLNGAIDNISGAMRGYGESLKPAIVALVGICGVRIAWVYTYFKTHHTFRILMMAYPVSWVITLAVMIVMYLYLRAHGLGEKKEIL